MSVTTDIKGSNLSKTMDSIIQVVELLGDDGKVTYYELVYRGFCLDVECFLLKPFTAEDPDAAKTEPLVYYPEGGTLKRQEDSCLVDAVRLQYKSAFADQKPTDRGFFKEKTKPALKPKLELKSAPPQQLSHQSVPRPAEPPPQQGHVRPQLPPQQGCVRPQSPPQQGYVRPQLLPQQEYVRPQSPPQQGYVKPQSSPQQGWAFPATTAKPRRKPSSIAIYAVSVVVCAVAFGVFLNVIVPRQSEPKSAAAVSLPSESSSSQLSVPVALPQDEPPLTFNDFIDKSEYEATQVLEKRGYMVRVRIEDTENDYEDGVVMLYEGDLDVQGSPITIIVGRYSEVSAPPQEMEVAVPMVVGEPKDYAKQMLEDEGFVVKEISRTTTKSGEDGIVMSCDVQGQFLTKGSTVTIYVGNYKAPVSSSLSSSSSVSSSSAPKPSSSSASSSSAPKPSSSSASASSSSKPVSSSINNWKPTRSYDVLMLTAEDARKLLEKNGYSVSESTIDVDRENYDGKVVRLDENALGKQGSTVTIYVGVSNVFTVPKIIGSSQQLATNRLHNKGFRVIVNISYDCSEKDDGKVIECEEEGNTLPKGESVTIVVGRYVDY